MMHLNVVVQYICDDGQCMMMKLYERLTAQRKGAAVSQVFATDLFHCHCVY